GAAVDLLCDTGQLAVLPELAAWRPPERALFLACERGLGAGGTVVANGLYSLAVPLAALALRGRVPAFALWLRGGPRAGGVVMVRAGLLGEPRLVELSTGPLIGGFLAWTVVVGGSLARAGPPA